MNITRLTPCIDLRTAYAMPAHMADCPDVQEDPDYWIERKYLISPVQYRFPDGAVIEIQPGFPSDGASIPLSLTALAYGRFDREVLGGALLHDWLYATNFLPRELCDEYLEQLWIADGVPEHKAWVMKEAVRYGGHGAYADSAKAAPWYRQYGWINPESDR